jgi:hypothetical protein
MRNTKIHLVVCFFLAVVRTGCAQVEAEAICLKKITSVDIQIEGGELKINEHYVTEKAFYKNFEKHSHESIYYSDLDPIINLEAKSLIPYKERFKVMDVEVIETKDIVQPGIFYGGYKRKDFAFPGLTQGAIGKLEYTKEIKDPHLLSAFYFNDEDITVETSEFTVTIPRGVTITHKIFGIGEDKILFAKEALGDKVKYSWKLTGVQPFHKDKDSPGRSFSAPHIIVFIESIEVKGSRKTVLSDVSDLYRWYSQLLKLMQASNNDVLKQAVDVIISGKKTDLEKTEAIFQWVQTNISYVAFENGMAGFVPRAASDVYVKRYGDCKDMANLLKCMIRIAGIDAYLTWIGTRSKPYSYYEVPSTIASNHMICSVNLNNQIIFLDATNSYTAFGKPSSMIQGKEALVGISEDNFKVVKVPIIERFENQRVDTARIKLVDRGINGNFSSWFKGYKKDDLEYKKLKNTIDKDNDFLEDFLNIGNNNIVLENAVIKGLGIQNHPANVRLSFSVPDYSKKVGDKIYVNLNLNKALPGERVDLNLRKQPIENSYRYEDRSIVIFEIPENYIASFIPNNSDKKWGDFGISTRYIKTGNRVELERTFYSDYLYLDETKFLEWNDMLKTVSEINQQSIILSKVN